MKRSKLFFRRNLKEMLRDKLGCFFFMGFPLVLLLMFCLINHYVTVELEMFKIPQLLPGIVIFAYTFVMLYTSMLVSKDKSTAFLVRLLASPMRPYEYILGYTAPGIVVGILQTVACFVAGNLILYVQKSPLLPWMVLPKIILLTLPALLMFVFLGMIFGAIFSEKSAPGVTSVLISVTGILSGAWMPLETMGKMETFASYLPFYPAVRLGRFFTTFGESFPWRDLLVICGYLVVMFILAVATFKWMCKRDR